MSLTIEDVVTIKVSRETYDCLKKLAVPFEDTPESVIVKLLDEKATSDAASLAQAARPSRTERAAPSGRPQKGLKLTSPSTIR